MALRRACSGQIAGDALKEATEDRRCEGAVLVGKTFYSLYFHRSLAVKQAAGQAKAVAVQAKAAAGKIKAQLLQGFYGFGFYFCYFVSPCSTTGGMTRPLTKQETTLLHAEQRSCWH